MFISIAHATSEVGAAAPDAGEMAWTNIGLIAVMFVLFYVIMIRPQQKRLKEQREMLDTLQKGDKVITGGGLYGTISKVVNDEEVEVDLGGTKVTAVRYTLQSRLDADKQVHTPSNDEKPAEKETKAKKAPAKKTTPKKSTAKKTEPAKTEPKKKA